MSWLHCALGVPAHGSPRLDFSGRPGRERRSFSPARGGRCSRAARLSAGPAACSGRPRSRAPGLGRVETTDGSRSRDLSTRAGNKSRVRTSGRDQPRLREGERREARRAAPAASRLRASRREHRPRGPAGRRGASQWGWGPSARWPQGFPGPVARTRGSRAEEPREGAGRWRGGGRTTREGIRLPGRRSHPPHPCGYGVGTCRSGCSSAPSLSTSPARRSPLSPPSRPPARRTP